MSIEIPFASYPGRAGTVLPISLRYSSKLWRINYSQSYQGTNREETWAFTKFAENSAAGWTSSLDPVRIVYSGDGEPFNGDDGSPYISDIDHPTYLT
jgi:hypothetical protein